MNHHIHALQIVMARLFFWFVFLGSILLPIAAYAQSDTLAVTLVSVIDRALEVSPDLDQARAQLEFAEARRSVARASRFLTEFNATTGHALVPGIENPNGTPLDRLYLDPDVRNDWADLRPYNQIDIELIQPVYTWGELVCLRPCRTGAVCRG